MIARTDQSELVAVEAPTTPYAVFGCILVALHAPCTICMVDMKLTVTGPATENPLRIIGGASSNARN